MRTKFVLILLVFLSIQGCSQKIEKLCLLDKEIEETSGLLKLGEKLITHNDSGGEPILYEFDSSTGKVTRKVVVTHAKNVDWEDITADDEFIYIADIGNNKGKRDNLKIYRIPISEYLTQDSVRAEKIKISYADQKNFNPGKFMTNYDAESLVSIGDSLYIFSKNWGNHQSRIYALPKKTGTYELLPKATFKAKCLVTGADYNAQNNEIVLVGYLYNKQFIMRLNEFGLNNISNGTFVSQEFKVPENGSKQIEGIVHDTQFNYFISAEAYQGNTQVLYRM
ncbi:MAG: hypothetical protein ACPGRC_10260, partial [Salibacteraceae bacterium]